MPLKFNGSRRDLRRSLRLINRVLAGKHADKLGIREVFWGRVGNAVLRLVSRAYRVKIGGGTADDGIKWAKLAVATLERRQRKGRTDHQILIETGELLDSLRAGRGHTPSGAPGQIFDIGPRSVTVGSFQPKADWHQHGNAHLPARPIVPPDGEIPERWLPEVERAIEEAYAEVLEIVVRNGGL